MSFSTKKFIISVSLFLCFTNLLKANTYDSIEYNLNLANMKNSVLKVEIVLKGQFKDKLVLDLPFKWAAATYTDQIKNIQINLNSTSVNSPIALQKTPNNS